MENRENFTEEPIFEEDIILDAFRSSGVSEETIKEVKEIMGMIRILLAQKEIFNGDYSVKNVKPLWEECQC